MKKNRYISGMKTTVDTNEIKQLHPTEHSKIVKAMAKKGVAEADIEWKYTYCVRIGHLDCHNPAPHKNPETIDEFVENIKETYGVALEGQNGRKYNSEAVDIKTTMPSYFLEIAKQKHAEQQRRKNHRQSKTANLDSVLDAVGKTGSSDTTLDHDHTQAGVQGLMFGTIVNALHGDRPEFPTLEDIKTARPDVYEEYAAKADGTKLVVYNPQATDCDEWGFNVDGIELATRRNGEDRVLLEDGFAYKAKDGRAFWMGPLRQIEKARAAGEGQEFRGWKNTKQYRLTKQEIEAITKGNIFTFGINF